MQLAKITCNNRRFVSFCVALFLGGAAVQAQDNSPYSRYGLGNEFPRTNITSRGMGGISAAYNDVTSVNYNNPASYTSFQTYLEQRSKKVSSGRVVLDVGLNVSSRTLSAPNTPKSFTSSDALFSHVYVGIPIRKNWGLSFGIRPISRIGYDVFKTERLKSPSGVSIDSVTTQFTGSGGSFLPTIGTGFGNDRLSFGFNVGYLFGRKEVSTKRIFLNDTVAYAAADYATNATFGNIFFNTGIQYTIDLTKKDSLNKLARHSLLRFGLAGNWKQTINGSQDILRQTFVRNSFGQELQVDSVYNKTDVSGSVIYPATYTAGVYYEKSPDERYRGIGVGLDYTSTQWNDYRFFGTQDLVQNNWELRLGAQITPSYQSTNFGQRTTFRFGLFTGQDYIKVDNKLPVYGVSLGAGLPIKQSRQSPNQYSLVNLAFEYSRRGNDNNQIKESLFRFSLGLNFTDLWFGKRKYD